TTYNNFDAGIGVGGLSKLVGKPGRKLEIEGVNHIDDGSKNGVFFGMISVRKKSSNHISGYIKIIDSKWINSRESGFVKRKFYGNVPNVEFSKIDDTITKDIKDRHRNMNDFQFKK